MAENRSTKRQRELLNFVDTFIQEHGYGPSYREVMAGLGYKSVSTVAIHIEGLITKGYLRKKDNSARSLEVVTAHFDDAPLKKKPTANQEKWLLAELNERFNQLETNQNETSVNELHILVESLKILGFDDAYLLMTAQLESLNKD